MQSQTEALKKFPAFIEWWDKRIERRRSGRDIASAAIAELVYTMRFHELNDGTVIWETSHREFLRRGGHYGYSLERPRMRTSWGRKTQARVYLEKESSRLIIPWRREAGLTLQDLVIASFLAREETFHRYLRSGLKRVIKLENKLVGRCWAYKIIKSSPLDPSSPSAILALPWPKISRDEQGRLHSETGPALRWKDDGEYYWHGVRVNKEIIENPETITLDQMLREANAETRRIMFERCNPRTAVMGVRLIHKDKDRHGNERRLFRPDQPWRYGNVLYCQCPSTGRKYLIPVSERVWTCHAAAAWSFRIRPSEYAPVMET